MQITTTVVAAAVLGITPRQVRNLLYSGQLQGQQLTPRIWLVNRQSLEELRSVRESIRQQPMTGQKTTTD